MAETVSAIVQFKRMTRAEWNRSNYVPKLSELVFESDTGYAKFGDGVNRYPQLKYLTGPQGPQGIQGIQGPPGRDGVVTFENLSQAQRNSLKGDRGEPGPRGLQGPPGPAGARGADGARGATGERGPIGPAGPRGADGLPINENLIPDSNIANGYSKSTWEDKVTNSGLQFHTGHAVNNLGRGLHIWGTPNAEYKGLSTAPFPLVAKRGDKVTLSMDLGKDALREDSTLRLGIHYMNGTNQIVSQEWQDLDLSTQGFEIRKYKRISKTFTVGSDITYCRVMIYATTGRLINFYIDNIKLERGEVATAWCPAYVDLVGPVYRIAKGDINGGNIGATATIQASELLNPDGVKVGDMIEDWLAYSTGADKEIWTVIAVNGTTITVKSLAKRVFPYYNDSDLKRRITTLENRPAPTGFVNQKTGQPMKYWMGSKADFDAISNKDANTIYDYFEE